MFGKLFLTIIFLSPLWALGQNRGDRKSTDRLEAEIHQLSDDSSAAAGSRYLEQQFRQAGLAPMGSHGYCQDVIYDEGKRYFPGTTLFINGQRLRPDTDFVPLPFGAEGTAEGEPLISVQEQQQPWILNIRNFQEGVTAQVSDSALYKQGERAVGDKAAAVLFYNAGHRDTFSQPPGGRLTIPAMYIQPNASQRYFSDPTASVKVKMKTAVYDKKDTACNMVGLINNHAPTTIIIGAVTPSDKAVLLELGRELKSGRHYQKQNYILVAFAPDKGAVSGLKYFSRHLPASHQKVSCFVNLEGTAKSNGGTLDVAGTGSSARWAKAVSRIRNKKMTVQDSPPPSCAPFYAKNIPAISVSYAGAASPDAAASALHFMSSLMRELNGSGRLSFNAVYTRTSGR